MLQPEEILTRHAGGWLQSGVLGISLSGSEDAVTASELNIRKFSSGLTNRNYRFSMANTDFVLRIAADNSQALALDRDAEYRIHQTVAQAGLIAPILIREPSDAFWVRPYVAGQELDLQCISEPLIAAVSNTFHSLHNLPLLEDIPVLNLQEKARAYWQMISDEGEEGEFHQQQQVIGQLLLQTFDNSLLALCHLDPTLNNWLATEHGLQLLDWEYAALANPLLDYAAFALAAGLSPAQQQRLLQTMTVSAYDWLLAKKQMQALSLLWYKAQRLISAEEFKQQCQALIKY